MVERRRTSDFVIRCTWSQVLDAACSVHASHDDSFFACFDDCGRVEVRYFLSTRIFGELMANGCEFASNDERNEINNEQLVKSCGLPSVRMIKIVGVEGAKEIRILCS